MEAPAGLLEVLLDFRERRAVVEVSFAYGECDAWVVLVHDAACAHGEVPYLAVAYFAPRKTDGDT